MDPYKKKDYIVLAKKLAEILKLKKINIYSGNRFKCSKNAHKLVDRGYLLNIAILVTKGNHLILGDGVVETMRMGN